MLSDGTQLGPYAIVAPLGAGGMGEVYRAKDTRLDREVAIKVLPDHFARDPERIARFQREAKALASLNHPHIAAIHGFEEVEGKRFLVMELVEGATLADRLRDGALPVEDALTIGRQIAEALEAAHERGIIHRDLKPANVKITPDGAVKVLDFGLAKAMTDEVSASQLAHSPTITAQHTRPGVVLGTAAYMSPEQARGKPVDKRTDIWSFGVVLYEALCGCRPFVGETATDLVAKILEREPDWSTLPPETPPIVQLLLRRCLAKDRNKRLHDIADARIDLEHSIADPTSSMLRLGDAAVSAADARVRRAAWRRMLPWFAANLFAVVVIVLFLQSRTPPASSLLGDSSKRFVIELPENSSFGATGSNEANGLGLALSSDGQRMVFAGVRDGKSQLFMRQMDKLEIVPIAGTDRGYSPFFSSNGEWLGFFRGWELVKVFALGGSPVTVGKIPPVSQGASWAPGDTIIFAPTEADGLTRISSSGADWRPFTSLDTSAGEWGHVWPQVLPGAKAVIFTVRSGKDPQDYEDSNIVVQIIESGERRPLIERAAYARYVPTGHLLFVRGGTLFAVPFDAERLRVTGEAVIMVEGILHNASNGIAQFAVSDEGTLVYALGDKWTGQMERDLVWVDRKGSEEPLGLPVRCYEEPSLSPDGKRLAVSEVVKGDETILVYELAQRRSTSLTSQVGQEFGPIWTPDGLYVTYAAYASNNPPNLNWTMTDGSGSPVVLRRINHAEFPDSWSPDGQMLAFTASIMAPGRFIVGADIWLLSSTGERAAKPWLESPHDEFGAMFSPDGRWIAYTSDESGRKQVYVRPYPGPGGKTIVSTDGGAEPLWARTGRELFYREGDKVLVVDVQTEPELILGTPKLLFQGNYAQGGEIDTARNYDVRADDQRFLMVKPTPVQSQPITRLHVVTNWFAELKAKVPTK